MQSWRLTIIVLTFIVVDTVAWATRFEYVVMRVNPVAVIRVNRYTGQAYAYMPLDHWVLIKDRDAKQQLTNPLEAFIRPPGDSTD